MSFAPEHLPPCHYVGGEPTGESVSEPRILPPEQLAAMRGSTWKATHSLLDHIAALTEQLQAERREKEQLQLLVDDYMERETEVE